MRKRTEWFVACSVCGATVRIGAFVTKWGARYKYWIMRLTGWDVMTHCADGSPARVTLIDAKAAPTVTKGKR